MKQTYNNLYEMNCDRLGQLDCPGENEAYILLDAIAKHCCCDAT